jgi:two-component system NtrC family sensor kinase
MAENPSDSEKSPDPRFLHFNAKQAQATQEALIHRPRISIRLRVVLGFLITFILTCGITISAMVLISNFDRKQLFLEKAANFEFEIQQARRFEKNYFLYGTNLSDALNHVQNAENLLEKFGAEMRQTVGNHSYESMSYNLGRYKESLVKLQILGQRADSSAVNERVLVESELRNFGGSVLAEASNTIDQERLRIHTWLSTSKVAAIAALVIILLLEIFLATYIARQIIRPFGRFGKYTQRIAGGDFSLITPARKYRDEFTSLAIALNQMILELKEREEELVQSRKMAAVGNLTAGIAHELNNPLNNISLTTESLLDDFDEWNREEKLKMLRDIFTQVERAGATVANLLDFTRRDETFFEKVSINEVIDRTLKLMSNEINLNNVQLELDLGDNLPRIRGSQHDLQQVFLNLFLNAIQAMPDGGMLKVSSCAEDKSLVIKVQDTGIGIPQENLERILEPFYTTKQMGEGTGLGLSVTYGIIKKHHGSINVESEVGKGSVFSIMLPIADSEPLLQ